MKCGNIYEETEVVTKLKVDMSRWTKLPEY